MRPRILFLALFICALVYLGNNNPSREKFIEWASKQYVQNSSFHQSLAKTADEEPNSVWGELAKMGNQLTEKYVQPQIGHVIDAYTRENNYFIASTYTTEYTIAGKTYTYVTLGMANRFWLISSPK